MASPHRSPDRTPQQGARPQAALPPPAHAEPAPSRIVVTAGNPTDAELAAVTVALAAAGHAQEQPAPTAPSRWLRAARLEGCGHPPISGPDGFPR